MFPPMSRNVPNPLIWLLYIRQTFLPFSHVFMSDRIICVLVRVKVRGHLVMSIVQFIHPI